MAKLILLCGMSNSGKSTYCSDVIQDEPDKYVRVNRDKIREMLYSYTEEDVHEYYQRKDIRHLETLVTAVENNLIENLLHDGKNVIVDATHLRARYLNRFDIFSMNEIEIVLFNIDLEEAKERNSKRTRKVPEDILEKQYNDYLNIKKLLTKNELKFDYICINRG